MTVKKDRQHHLRLHSDSVATTTSVRQNRRRGNALATKVRDDVIDQFLEAYTDVTGWRLDEKEGLEGPKFDLQPANAFDAMMTSEDFDSGILPAVGRGDARRLAAAAAELTGQLNASQAALQSREAELAAFEARLGRLQQLDSPPASSQADRLQRILADGVAATGFDAAAAYLLSEDTTEIKLRCLFGLDPRRLMEPARSLAESRGDLEAMVCGVCAIDDLDAVLMDTWNCPEPGFAAALCATINAGDLPLGTLWMFAREATKITPKHTAAARLTASHLAAELTSFQVAELTETSVRIAADVGSDLSTDISPQLPQVDSAAEGNGFLEPMTRWQYESLPHGTQISDEFFVDGMIESGKTWSVGWHHWDILPDGQIAFLMAEATDRSTAGAMTSAFAKAAAISHLGYRHNVQGLLRRVADSLWQSGVAGQTCSMLYATIDPETGEGELASAGTLQAIIGGRHGHRPLVAANDRPLAMDFDPSFASTEFRIQSGETLLCCNQSLSKLRSTDTLGHMLAKAASKRSRRPLAHLARDLSSERLSAERSAAVITKK